jgi:transcriptional regulator with XRE-family HTH domain
VSKTDAPVLELPLHKSGCIECRVNNKTLAKILKGEMPRRLDAFYRLCEGLKIPVEEALINGRSSQAPSLTLIEGRRRLTS